MYEKLQSVALSIATIMVLGGCLTCFFFPREVGQRYLGMRRLPEDFNWSVNRYGSHRAARTAVDCARRGRLDVALDQFSRLIALEPQNALFRHWRTLVQLELEDHEQYRRDCGEAVEQFAGANDALQPFLVSWTCCLARDAVADYSPVLDWAQAAPESSFCRLIWGASLYRAGKYEQAVRRLTEADQLAPESDANLESSLVYTWFFLAMAHHKRGHDVEAMQWLHKAAKSTDQVVGEDAANLPWDYRLTLKLLRNEADALLKPDRAEPTERADETMAHVSSEAET